MESIMADFKHLLDGYGITSENSENVVDVIDKKGNIIPETKKTVGYIVCAVILNDNGDILLIQEAKSSCYGKWYLPAGRMEPNETIDQAVQREVKEETGLLFQPTSLLSLEASDLWYRFSFVGLITGGMLKTLQQQDAESLQAQWWPVTSVLSSFSQDFFLRSDDVLTVINLAAAYKSGSLFRHHEFLPVSVAHKQLLVRLILIDALKESDNVQILIGLHKHAHFPTAVTYNIRSSVTQLLQEIFFSSLVECRARIHGILSVVYDGRPAHVSEGVCVTLLASLHDSGCELTLRNNFVWKNIDTTLNDVVKQLMKANALPPLL